MCEGKLISKLENMLKPIQSNEDHEKHLARAYELMQKDLNPNSKEPDELEAISILVEAYEKN